MSRLRFGTFLAPFHPAGENPTRAIQRDLRLIEHLDELGFDEAWIGEHHSAGTRDHRLAGDLHRGRGRAHEEHQAGHRRDLGRATTTRCGWPSASCCSTTSPAAASMLGLGPGSLPTDSAMIGLNPTDTRELLEENLDIIMRLLRGEAVTAQTRTHNLVDARLHLRALLRAAASTSPSPRSPRRPGPRLAGQHGVGLLSIGATLTADGLRRARPPLERHGGAGAARSAPPSTGRSGGWSACSTSPRPASRPTATSSTASRRGSATSRRRRRSRRWPSRAATSRR